MNVLEQCKSHNFYQYDEFMLGESKEQATSNHTGQLHNSYNLSHGLVRILGSHLQVDSKDKAQKISMNNLLHFDSLNVKKFANQTFCQKNP